MRCVQRTCYSMSRSRPSKILLQQRGLATHRDATYKQTPYEKRENVGDRKYSQFDVGGKVFVVTGGGQGLGFSIAEGLVEAGGMVHVLDRSPEPTQDFEETRKRAKEEFDGGLAYHQTDVADADLLGRTISDIAAQKQRLDGLVAGLWRPRLRRLERADHLSSCSDPAGYQSKRLYERGCREDDVSELHRRPPHSTSVRTGDAEVQD